MYGPVKFCLNWFGGKSCLYFIRHMYIPKWLIKYIIVLIYRVMRLAVCSNCCDEYRVFQWKMPVGQLVECIGCTITILVAEKFKESTIFGL